MRESLRKLCDSFIINRDLLKKHFKAQNAYITPICASIFASKGITAEAGTLDLCKNLLKSNTGAFSYFRGTVMLPVISMLATDSKPDEKMAKIVEMYSILKKYFSATEHLAYTAAVLADMIELSEADALIQRGKALYKMMRKEHPFITSSEDCVFAVLMAFSNQIDKELIQDMEMCYTTLKPIFSYGNYVQAMSHVITLAGGDIKESCRRVAQLYTLLKDSGRKYGHYHELAVLSALAVLPADTNSIVEDILQANDFLAQQKGYGFWGLDKKTRLMHAAILVSYDYSQNPAVSAAAVTGTIAMIAAQQAATYAAIAASTAAAASSASN